MINDKFRQVNHVICNKKGNVTNLKGRVELFRESQPRIDIPVVESCVPVNCRITLRTEIKNVSNILKNARSADQENVHAEQ